MSYMLSWMQNRAVYMYWDLVPEGKAERRISAVPKLVTRGHLEKKLDRGSSEFW